MKVLASVSQLATGGDLKVHPNVARALGDEAMAKLGAKKAGEGV